MEFEITRDAGGRPRLELRDAPPSVTALESSQPVPEEGAWLVMAVPTWSAPDILAIARIEGVAARFGSAVHFGIRPFDDVEELRPLAADIDWGPTPIWLTYRNGELRTVHRGLLDEEQLAKIVEELIESGEPGS